MNMKTLFSFLLISLVSLSYQQVSAQSTDPDEDVNLWMSQPVVVDGNSAEWHEPLNNYNTPTQLAFALANDQQNLYLIIESLDEATTGKLLRGGLTLNINTAGKKKDGIKLNFLGMQHPPAPHDMNDTVRQEETAMMGHMDREHAPGVTVIQVSGFKKIPDGSLSIPNNEGIQVAAAFNKQRDYICELAIPLTLLELKGDEVKAIAYNIKINAPGRTERPNGKRPPEGGGGGGMHGGGMGGGMGGGGGMSHGGGGGMGGGGGRHGGGMRGGMAGESSGGSGKSSDFWVKYELAKPAASFRAN
jgi:hypothetical protein